MRADAKPSPLPWWNAVTQKERAGFVFAMRSDGMTLAAIGGMVGRSAEVVRQYERIALTRIRRATQLHEGKAIARAAYLASRP